ncbi:DUF6470 family protein [Paenibacillus filicis]|uniref:DUF6470 family protein n=1 Tax=Paenibacillus gyeongsangnamensis TaxID=3388067 RepID=A0ABT4QDD6_9BACL|nr:DUF6470 family protein [Paenibacillus filicis]MCZ8514874.1 DUF6470 family protein [Paenibacillus filicis]
MSIPHIQIRQQYGQLGIDAELGKLDIKQPQATFEITTERPKLDIHAEQGVLYVDSSKAWDALGHGPALETMSKIYSRAHEVAMQGIARIVEEGNRLAAIHEGGNAIAEIAKEKGAEFFEFEFMGDASVNNVDMHYVPGKLDIQVHEGKVNINTYPNPPEINYTRGKLDFYMMQYPKVEIIPPQIDAKG